MTELNEAAILDQIREHWQKFAALILWKATQGKSSIVISSADIEAFASSGLMLLTHGHHDSIEFRLVTPAQAQVLVAHNETMKGRA